MPHQWLAPMHLLGPDEHLLSAVLVVGALGSGFIISLAVVAFAQRRSWSYLLVTLALGTLFVRTGFGLLSLRGTIAPMSHHIVEHGLDVLTVALLLGALYLARGVDPRGDPDA